MTTFLRFMMDGLRLIVWLILMRILAIIFFVFIMPHYLNLPGWLTVILNPLLAATIIVVVVISFCWVFGLKFSTDNPPDWYHLFEALFNFKSFPAFLRGLGCLALFFFIITLSCYFTDSVVEVPPEGDRTYWTQPYYG